MINFQGQLSDADGSPVDDNMYSMSFRVYDAAVGGTLLWLEDQSVTVTDGVYNVLLGSATPTFGALDVTLFSSDNRWLEIAVSGEAMTPRLRITSVAYSLQSENADVFGGMSASTILPKGTNLTCSGDNKVTGINSTSGDVICGSDIDNYNAAYDTEAEIDAAVANNGYSIGPHTVDTNAATICGDNYYLKGDCSCSPADESGDCDSGMVCAGGHTHSLYSDASNITSGTLATARYDAYADLTDAGRLDNTSTTDILTRDQLDGRYLQTTLRSGYLFIDAATMVPSSNTTNYGRLNGGIYTLSPSTFWYGAGNVDLPDGATITMLGVYYQDSNATEDATFRCDFYRRSLSSFSVETITSIEKVSSGLSDTVRNLYSGAIASGTETVVEAFLFMHRERVWKTLQH